MIRCTISKAEGIALSESRAVAICWRRDMSEALVAHPILAEAEKRENEYDWLGAAESYEKSLHLVSEQDFSKRGEVCERLGFTLYRTTMQADTGEEFRQRIRRAIRAYQTSSGLYDELSGPGERARSLRSQAMISHLGLLAGLGAN